ncbi:hypothetical protein [Mammaliicoccus sciuri]|uniref:hypothetical protein n=1 Tax=Mammaliicoccus sciuri TaxID=1296 RepID=UPI002DB9EBD7|nr:hypothetical protein [Mammaliicoccus sciuri]MEB5758304.1 hypothetical protein [Mammaliicoccus sciuri]
MAYEYEEPLTKKFNEEYRAGRIPNLDLFNELKEVYAKAKAFDEILDIDLAQHDEEYADNVMKVVNKYMEDK